MTQDELEFAETDADADLRPEDDESDPGLSQDDRTWGMVVHLSALSGYLLGGLAGFVAPLVIWLVKKDESDFVDDQGREALNFQLTIFIGMLVSIPLCFILVGFLTLLALVVIDIVYTIIAGIKANEGVWYRYPWSIKFLSRPAAAQD